MYRIYKLYIKEERLKKGLSIEKLAMLSGVGKSTISNIENDIVTPKLDTIIRLSLALKIDINNDLFKIRMSNYN